MLEIKNLCVSSGKREILRNINLEIKPHTVTVILGKNAAGKSTLISCLTGERKYRGTVSFFGKNLAMLPPRERASLIALLPQYLPKAELTVEELVRLGRTPYLDFAGRFCREDKLQVEKAISQVGIAHLKDRSLSRISGGERQKAYLAMILAQNTRLIALDEPSAYMDPAFSAELYTMISELAVKKKKTVLAVMHDLTAAMEIADNVIVIDGGEVIFASDKKTARDSGIIEKTFGVKRYDAEEMTFYR
ncbi:MAG: ABC transporter ATP-binding protein [Clostridia bacterium]|nr:ABC transporter ATP-binding protein [Clostridia bacterium]